ncbi:hypothetical protein FB45DRAFT_1129596 [Roridomyces roridus]|uniref:Uncharacterized protein n=1 Tax=Roridomyces roridus TaxID=1738132 RepID=A0AAD7B245_9AGAR|nr:hypothetical protein FB45DRAFT_1129596 [Roridomyces roridus]
MRAGGVFGMITDQQLVTSYVTRHWHSDSHLHLPLTMPFSLANFSTKTPGMPPDIQLASSDPLACEERWEQVFAVAKGRWSVVRECLHKTAISPSMQDPNQQDDVIRCTFFTAKDLVRAPDAGHLRCLIVPCRECAAAEMDVSVAREAWRDYSSWLELSVESHRQNGRLFLDLLEQMTVPNPTVASPTYISSPEWDAIAADQQSPDTTVAAKIALANCLVERNTLIGYVVNFALCSILDLPLPVLYQMKSGKPSKLQEIQPSKDRVRAACGEEASKVFGKFAREMGKGMYAQQKEPNDTTTKYPRCKRCWDTMEREVVYCSSCRVPKGRLESWTQGVRKTLSARGFDTFLPEQQSPQISPGLSGFKRPGALLFQVAQLKRLSPEYDYLIFLNEGQAYFSFPHPLIRAAFRTCRDKAMTTGDRRAVAMLGHFLFFVYNNASQPKKIGVDPADMMEPIETEYDFPEILRAVAEMEERRFLDSAQRPPLIADAGVSAAEWKAIPSTWLDVGVVSSFPNPVWMRKLEQAS